MINILTIATEAADSTCNANATDFNPEFISILEEKFIIEKTLSLLMADPIISLASSTKAGIAVIQMIAAWYWQMGRLYGQQETIDQFLSEKVK